MSVLPLIIASSAIWRPSGDHDPTLTHAFGRSVSLRRFDPSRLAIHTCPLPFRSDVNATYSPSGEKRPGVSWRVASQNGWTAVIVPAWRAGAGAVIGSG